MEFQNREEGWTLKWLVPAALVAIGVLSLATLSPDHANSLATNIVATIVIGAEVSGVALVLYLLFGSLSGRVTDVHD